MVTVSSFKRFFKQSFSHNLTPFSLQSTHSWALHLFIFLWPFVQISVPKQFLYTIWLCASPIVRHTMGWVFGSEGDNLIYKSCFY